MIGEDEVRACAQAHGILLSSDQVRSIVTTVRVLQQCGERVRDGISRNDEPAFGFGSPVDRKASA